MLYELLILLILVGLIAYCIYEFERPTWWIVDNNGKYIETKSYEEFKEYNKHQIELIIQSIEKKEVK